MAIDRLIGLRVDVKVTGLDDLSKYEAMVKRIADANIRLQKAQGNFTGASSTSAQAGAFFSAAGKPFNESAFAAQDAQTRRTAERLEASARAQAATAAARRERDFVQNTIAQARVIRQTKDYRAEVDLLGGALNKVQTGSTAFFRIQERLLQARNAQAAQPGTLSNLGSGLLSAFNGFTRITAAIFLLRAALNTIGGLLKSVFVDPLTSVAKLVLDATDKFRKLEITISGITGSRSSARGVIRDTLAAARGLPITGAEAISTIVKTGFNPSNALSLVNPSGRQDRIRDLLGVITKLGVIDPEQGPEGAQFAIREALAGQFRSLRTRFEVSPETIAQLSGVNLKELGRSPELVISALKKFTDLFVGDEAIKSFSDLLSTQARKLRDLLDQFFALSGEQGFYDKVVGFLKRLNTGIEQGLDDFRSGRGGTLAVAAKTINDALSGLFDSLLDSTSGVVGSLIGKSVDLRGSLSSGDVGSIASAGADFINALSTVTRQFIVVGGDLVASVGSVARRLGFIKSTDPVVLQKEINDLEIAIENQAKADRARNTPSALRDALPFIFSGTDLVKTLLNGGRTDELQTSLAETRARLNRLQGLPDDQGNPVEAARDRIAAERTRRLSEIPGEQGRFGTAAISAFQASATGLRALDERDILPSQKALGVELARRQARQGVRDAGFAALSSLDSLNLRGGEEEDAKNDIILRNRLQQSELALRNTEIQRRLIVDAEQNLSRFSRTGQIVEGNRVLDSVIFGLQAGNGVFHPSLTSSFLGTAGQVRKQEGQLLGEDTARNRARGKLRALREQVATQGAREVFASGNIEEAQRKAEDFREAISKIDDELLLLDNRFQDTFENLRQSFEEFTASVSGGFQTAFSDTLVSIFQGTSDKIGDILKNLANTIQKAIADALVQTLLIQSLLNPLLNRAFGTNSPTNDLFGFGANVANSFGSAGLSRLLGGGGGTPGGFPGGGGGDVGAQFQRLQNGSVPIGTDGGLDFSTQLDFARGGRFGAAYGIITRPNTMIRTAEDGTPEVLTPNAVIPLRGNSMAGIMAGPSRRDQRPVSVTVLNVLDSGEVVRRGVASDPSVIVNNVVGSLSRRGSAQRVVRRVVS